MKYRGSLKFIIGGLLLFAIIAIIQSGMRAQNVVIDFQQRELKAPAAIKTKLTALRQEIKVKKLTFNVGYTTAMDLKLEQLAGLKVPANIAQIAKQQNTIAEKIIKELKIVKIAACSATAGSFDWRKVNGSTPVRNQGACGSCWAFATHGAFEGSYRIRNNVSIDSSEQDTLDCSGAGTCAGGWWAHQYLINTGSATEASYAYTAVKGTCKNTARPYKAVVWGYVDGSGSVPSVAKLKQALCQYGPLAVAVRVTPAFQAYTGGVFNESATGNVNHGVTLIGWDDSKGAWLIKNSWSTGWGDTCGYGSEKGYMWISYTSNKIGYAASWVQAKPIAVLAKEDCISFNPNTATVKKINGRWKIVDGNHMMFDFANNEAEAKKALAIIKFYKMDSTCFVGRPDPSFEYLLANKKAPSGAMAGEDCVSFNPNTAAVKKINGRWKIVDGNHMMFDFGNNEEEAEQALTFIKKYGFTKSCFVGRPNPSFKYLRK